MPDQALPDAWIETALKVTGHFEDSDDPLGAASGDFDGMGISVGVLQWNIGSGSLQPLVRAVGRAEVVTAMPAYGVELWTACTSNIALGLATVRGWQVGQTLRKPVRAELKAFAHSPAFVRQQISASREVAKRAWAAAREWSSQDPHQAAPSKSLFCWFFDVLTQNGGMKGIGYHEVAAFMDANGLDRADDVICDWLAARGDGDAGFRDSRQNAPLWRNKVGPDKLPLLVASFLRAMKSRQGYRGDVLNRKAAIAVGEGWVHMEKHDLRGILGG